MPGQISAIEGPKVVIDYFGERRDAVTDGLDGLAVGDYVYSQNGFIIKKVERSEAHEILKTWQGLFEFLKKEDERQSRSPASKPSDKKLAKILLRASNGAKLSNDELVYLLSISKSDEIEFMCQTANNIRHRTLDNSCCVHGILEFSNVCSEDCHYCGIRASNKSIIRARLGIDEIVAAAKEAVDVHGFKTLLIQSGEDNSFSDDDLVEIVKRIRSSCGCLLFASIGERSTGCYKKIYDAGARGVLLRFETSNPEIYRSLHPNSDLDSRVKLLRSIAGMGYLIATGSLIGLPVQTHEDIIADIRLAHSLNSEMYSFSPVVPAPNTPLENISRVSVDVMLRLTSVIRFIVPNARILVSTATETLGDNAKELVLRAGGNSLMLNVTPIAMRRAYDLYPGKVSDDSLEEQINSTVELLKGIGRAPTDLGR